MKKLSLLLPLLALLLISVNLARCDQPCDTVEIKNFIPENPGDITAASPGDNSYIMIGTMGAYTLQLRIFGYPELGMLTVKANQLEGTLYENMGGPDEIQYTLQSGSLTITAIHPDAVEKWNMLFDSMDGVYKDLEFRSSQECPAIVRTWEFSNVAIIPELG